jgi:hypothetical protein
MKKFLIIFFLAYITVYNEPGIMASGKRVYDGAVACSKNLKLGTNVEIDGRIYTCEDRYASWLDKKRGLSTFDIWMKVSNKEARKMGLRKMEVKIIK